MKKLLLTLLTLTMILTVSACGKKEEKAQETELVGGWTEAQDSTITPELQTIFDKAFEGMVGASYKPIKLLATQVVSGTNYKFLAEQTTVTANPETKKVVVEIYEDAQGNVSVTEITDYKE